MTHSVCYKIYGQDFHIEPDSVQFANAVFHDEYRINDLRSHNVRTILDVGSHVGSFTVMAHHYWPNARIVAVEPFWSQVTDFGIDEVELIKLDCEGAEYLIISE